MIQLLDGGAYLIHGTEIVPDGADAAAEVRSKTGQEVSKEAAAQNTMAYGILKEHNTSGNMEKLNFSRYYFRWYYPDSKSIWTDQISDPLCAYQLSQFPLCSRRNHQ